MAEGQKVEGPGERAEKARRNRYALTFGALMIVGGVIGAVLTALGPYGSGSLHPAVAIAVTALLITSAPLGSWFFLRDIDEVELRINLIASAWAVNAYMVLYPCWYILWKGGLVSEPSHEILFVTTMIVLGMSYFWKKARP